MWREEITVMAGRKGCDCDLVSHCLEVSLQIGNYSFQILLSDRYFSTIFPTVLQQVALANTILLEDQYPVVFCPICPMCSHEALKWSNLHHLYQRRSTLLNYALPKDSQSLSLLAHLCAEKHSSDFPFQAATLSAVGHYDKVSEVDSVSLSSISGQIVLKRRRLLLQHPLAPSHRAQAKCCVCLPSVSGSRGK